ncbi:hypothetical protein [Streptomyces sp. NPDC001717]|uniref:hypothetical protein n=1 Tax=Streptomyces sp. NPDC001717 TaxID=3364604 RepID=UPI0036AC307E
MTRILAIHGVNQYDPARTPDAAAARLGAVWHQALNRELPAPVDAVDMRLVYYADLLRPTGPAAQGATDDLDHLSPEAADAARRWGEAHGLDLNKAQGRVLTPVRWVADAVAQRKGLDSKLVRRFVASFFPELVAYLHSPARQTVQRRLADAISKESPTVLIAHSLGSVVAYDTLWQHAHKVDVLLTIGSPLAMPDIVFPHLQHKPRSGKGVRPNTVGHWINIADPGDLVAIPQPLTKHFDDVDSNLSSGIGAFSFHKAVSYLKCSATAEALAPFLG